MRTDFLDFPTAWEIQKGYPELEHQERCSSVLGWAFSGLWWLCDCGAVEAKWAALVTELGEKEQK